MRKKSQFNYVHHLPQIKKSRERYSNTGEAATKGENRINFTPKNSKKYSESHRVRIVGKFRGNSEKWYLIEVHWVPIVVLVLAILLGVISIRVYRHLSFYNSNNRQNSEIPFLKFLAILSNKNSRNSVHDGSCRNLLKWAEAFFRKKFFQSRKNFFQKN